MKSKHLLLIITVAILVGYFAGYSHRSTLSSDYSFDEDLFHSELSLEILPYDNLILMNQLERISHAEEAYRIYSLHGNGDFRIYSFLINCRQVYGEEVYNYLNKEDYNNQDMNQYIEDFRIIAEIIYEKPEIEYTDFKSQLKNQLKKLGKHLE